MSVCKNCWETLTSDDEAEHRRRAGLAKTYGSIILQDPNLCTNCLGIATKKNGLAVKAKAAASSNTSPYTDVDTTRGS